MSSLSGFQSVATYGPQSHVHTALVPDSLSDYELSHLLTTDDGTKHRLDPRKGGGKGGGKGGKGKGQRGKNRDTDFGKAFEAFSKAKSAIVNRLRLIGRGARMLARGSVGTASTDLPSDEDIRKDLNDLKEKFIFELTAKQQGDEGHYNKLLESLKTAIPEPGQKLDQQKVDDFVSEWDSTVAWTDGEQQSGSTRPRPWSAMSVVLGSAAAGLAGGSFFGGSVL